MQVQTTHWSEVASNARETALRHVLAMFAFLPGWHSQVAPTPSRVGHRRAGGSIWRPGQEDILPEKLTLTSVMWSIPFETIFEMAARVQVVEKSSPNASGFGLSPWYLACWSTRNRRCL